MGLAGVLLAGTGQLPAAAVECSALGMMHHAGWDTQQQQKLVAGAPTTSTATAQEAPPQEKVEMTSALRKHSCLP